MQTFIEEQDSGQGFHGLALALAKFLTQAPFLLYFV